MHPQYDDDTTDFDYAVVTLEEEIDFSSDHARHIRPICETLAPIQEEKEVQ